MSSVLEQMYGMTGKRVIVTGGAQGIGKTVATRMAQLGAEIALFDLQDPKVKAAAEEISKETGQKVIGIGMDVTDPKQVKSAIEKAVSELGDITLLFNNAGIVLHKSAYDVLPEEWDRVINVNLNGEYYMASEFARYLKSKGLKGSIVNTASMSAHIVNWPQEQASYNASKAAVVHMTKSLAVEYVNDGIRVNCISPGYMYTELTKHVNQDWQDRWMDLSPGGRYGTPDELAGGVIYLLSDSASFTTGTDLLIDGGFTAV